MPFTLQPLGRLPSLPIIQIPPPTNILYTSTSPPSPYPATPSAPHSFPRFPWQGSVSVDVYLRSFGGVEGCNLTHSMTTKLVKTESCPCPSMCSSTCTGEKACGSNIRERQGGTVRWLFKKRFKQCWAGLVRSDRSSHTVTHIQYIHSGVSLSVPLSS